MADNLLAHLISGCEKQIECVWGLRTGARNTRERNSVRQRALRFHVKPSSAKSAPGL